MTARKAPRLLSLGAALALAIGITFLSPPATAATVRTVYYDASRVSAYSSQVSAAATAWNSKVTNVRLQAGSPATVTLYTSTGWPMAQPSGLGAGRIYIGQQAIDGGADVTRIVAHEFGHILGLPDNRTGLCSDLMSGSSAPNSCTNPYPSSTEAARVDRNFAGAAQTQGQVPANPVGTGLIVG